MRCKVPSASVPNHAVTLGMECRRLVVREGVRGYSYHLLTQSKRNPVPVWL